MGVGGSVLKVTVELQLRGSGEADVPYWLNGSFPAIVVHFNSHYFPCTTLSLVTKRACAQARDRSRSGDDFSSNEDAI